MGSWLKKGEDICQMMTQYADAEPERGAETAEVKMREATMCGKP